MPTKKNMNTCAACPARVNLLRCSGCCTELYCSVACQRAARPLHAPFCKGVQRRAAWRSTTGFDCCPYCRVNPRTRAADLSPYARHLTQYFYSSVVLEDSFPMECIEGAFCTSMGTPEGSYMLGCWQRLLCMGSILLARENPQPYACPAALAAAIEAGTLPALFERATRGAAAFSRGEWRYLQRRVDLGFASLPWDEGCLQWSARLCRSGAMEEQRVSAWVFSDAAPAAPART